MPDISKCEGIDCPLKTKCYRFTSTPSEFWQTYSDFTPELNEEKTECSYFLEIWEKK
jgi:hypothetical protein